MLERLLPTAASGLALLADIRKDLVMVLIAQQANKKGVYNVGKSATS